MTDTKPMTLREMAEKMRSVYPELEWVVYDGVIVRGYTKSQKPRPVGTQWMGGNPLFSLVMSKKRVKCPEAKAPNGMVNYAKAIFGFEDFYKTLQVETEEKDKFTSRKKGVIAYCADGSTILFDTFKECKAFYDLRSVSDVRDAIDNGKPMPDGTTFIDEVPDEEFMTALFKS